jgi:hypothetical protein
MAAKLAQVVVVPHATDGSKSSVVVVAAWAAAP